MDLTKIRTCNSVSQAIFIYLTVKHGILKTGNYHRHQKNFKAVGLIAKNLLIFAIVVTLFIPSNAFALVTRIAALDAELDDSKGGTFTVLNRAFDVATFTVGSTPYAIVASIDDNGVQIINLSDPTAITAADAATDGSADGFGGTFTELVGAAGVATFTVDSTLYAIVAGFSGNSVQIINLSDPANIKAADAAIDGSADGFGGTFTTLAAATGVATFTVGGVPYAIVASQNDNGVQIINLSDPANIKAADAATQNSADGFGGTFTVLARAFDVATFTVSSVPYAIVASLTSSGVQIINLSDPTAITAADAATNGNEGFNLFGAFNVATFTVGSIPYAIVANNNGDGVQIINLSDPTAITAVDAATDGSADGFGGTFTELDGAVGVETFVSDDTYAIVTAFDDKGVQIINLSDPANIKAVDAETDGNNSFTALDGATGVATFTVDSTLYAIVASGTDDGVQIINLEATPPTFTADRTALNTIVLTFNENVSGTAITDSFTVAGASSVTNTAPSGSTSVTLTTVGLTATDGTPAVAYVAATGDLVDAAANEVANGESANAADSIAPSFVEAFQIGSKSIIVVYDEPVTTVFGDYAGIDVNNAGAPETATSVDTSFPASILVKWNTAAATAGLEIDFTIGAVTDTSGNALSNGGAKTIAAQAAATVETTTLTDNDGDGDVEIPLSTDILIDTIVAPANVDPIISVTDFAAATDGTITALDGTDAKFPATTITVQSDDATIEFPPSVEVNFPNSVETITIAVSVKDPSADAEFTAAFPNIDLANANVIEFGNTATDLTFSVPVKITIPGLAGTVFSIDSAGDTKEILACDGTVVDSSTADTFIGTITGDAVTDGEACFVGTDIFTKHFSGFGSGSASASSSGGGGGGDATPPSIVTTFGDADYPVSVGSTSYTAEQLKDSVDTATVETGKPLQISLLLYDNGGPQNISHVAMYVDRHGTAILNDLTETYIVWDKNKDIQIINPYGIISDGAVESSIQGNKVSFTFDVTFAKEFDKSDILFVVWDAKRNGMKVLVQDALQVIPAEPVPEPDVVQDSELGVESVVTTEEFITMDPKPEVPDWVKNHAGWWAEGQIDDSSFTNGIEFLIQEKIIDIDRLPNVSKDPDQEDEELEEETAHIPEWVKNNAKWWADGLLTEEDFLNGIKYLVEKEIIRT